MDNISETLFNVVREGSNNKYIFLAFMTQTCQGCTETYQALKKFSKDFVNVGVIVIDANRHMKLCQHFSVSGVPTIFTYHKEKLLITKAGPHSYRKLKKVLKLSEQKYQQSFVK